MQSKHTSFIARNIIIHKMNLIVIVSINLCLSFACQTLQAEENATFKVPENCERICLSLRVFFERLENCLDTGKPIPQEYNNLCGIGYLEGYIIDQRMGNDVVLIGLRDKRKPHLYLDDLVLAWRQKGQTHDYPYCSLDPRQEDTKALQELFDSYRNISDYEQLKKLYSAFSAKIGPQMIVIGGVPRNSRIAHVMIDADYHMKKVSQGLIALPNVTSCLDLSLNKGIQALTSGSPQSQGISMARFWFSVAPGEPTFTMSEGILWIEKCSVVVLPKKQMATESGELVDVEADDPNAVAFADNLSKEYPNLTSSVSDYADLENLYRLRALLSALAFDSNGVDWFSSKIAKYKYQNETPMDSFKPGLTNFREWSQKTEDGNQIIEHFLFPMVGGGVDMKIAITENCFRLSDNKELNVLIERAISQRPSMNALVWKLE